MDYAMVNFVCQLDWVTGYPDICLAVLSGCVCAVVSEWGLTFELVRLGKVVPSPIWVSFAQSIEGLDKIKDWLKK